MVILGRQWIQPQVKDFLFTGFLRDLAVKHGNFMGCSWEYNGNHISMIRYQTQHIEGMSTWGPCRMKLSPGSSTDTMHRFCQMALSWLHLEIHQLPVVGIGEIWCLIWCLWSNCALTSWTFMCCLAKENQASMFRSSKASRSFRSPM